MMILDDDTSARYSYRALIFEMSMSMSMSRIFSELKRTFTDFKRTFKKKINEHTSIY